MFPSHGKGGGWYLSLKEILTDGYKILKNILSQYYSSPLSLPSGKGNNAIHTFFFLPTVSQAVLRKNCWNRRNKIHHLSFCTVASVVGRALFSPVALRWVCFLGMACAQGRCNRLGVSSWNGISILRLFREFSYQSLPGDLREMLFFSGS